MSYDPERHHRRSIRLKEYDYSQAGAYFVTICTQDRAHLFGDVVDGEMRLNDVGRMVVTEWERIPERFLNIELDAFIVMPNHIHGIIVIIQHVGAGLVPAQNGATPVGAGLVPAQDGATTRVAPTVGDVVGAFKSRVTVEYIRRVKKSGWPPFRGRLWQRNYYEHIIRDEESLNRIREYIATNPLRWHLDRENPFRVGDDDLWDNLFIKEVAS
jgi:REP element-mobilizing transposase RayT